MSVISVTVESALIRHCRLDLHQGKGVSGGAIVGPLDNSDAPP